jgi:ORF6N domain
MSDDAIVPIERVLRTILVVRDHKVILDADLAQLYGVTTKRLNEQVKRNQRRFPEDFMFQLTQDEKVQLVANCDHLKRLKFSPVLPYVFTEHGAIMAASVLNTERAVDISLYVVRAFIRLRQLLATNTNLSHRLDDLERKYDGQFRVVFNAIRQLMMPPEPKRRSIGFHVKETKAAYKTRRRLRP